MNSCIYLDIGNSNAKWKYKDNFFQTPTLELNIAELPESSKIWISNASSDFVFKVESSMSLVESQTRYKSLVNSYDEPNMLGSDRWLAMIASYELSPGKSFIVIDIGTAVTIDHVNNSGLHMGGVIFPGLSRIRNTFDHFPVSKEINAINIGQSTKTAWSIGTLNLIVNGINQKIYDLKVNEPSVNIYITGGGFEEVEKYLDFSFTYHKYLVLDGLELFANNMG